LASVAVTEDAPGAASEGRPLALWLLLCAAMVLLMVVIGGITRLTESGLSITEWQPVAGVLPPLSKAAWQDAFEKYKAIPQYAAIHSGMTLGDFKRIFFWEYLHRLWGRLIGVAFAVPFLYFLARGRIPRALAPRLAGLFALGGLQGVLGWYMVESGLADRIEVSQYRLAAHLLAAVIIYIALLWVALDLLRPAAQPARDPRQKRLGRGVGALLLLVLLTLTAGAFLAGLRGGLFYNSFPLMNGSVLPDGYAALAPFYRNWFENPAAANFDHRLLAELTWAATALLWLYARAIDLPRGARAALHALFALVSLQAALGIATLLLVVPLPLAVAHQAGAMLVVTAAVVARHALRAPRRAGLDAASARAL
jgi:cytochrome c oxidase assembly protein subunit 15